MFFRNNRLAACSTSLYENKVLDDLKVQRRGKLKSLDYPALSSPRHIYFKRQKLNSGLYFYSNFFNDWFHNLNKVF